MKNSADFPWARHLSWARVLLSALAVALAAAYRLTFVPTLALLILFLGAALLLSFRERRQRGLLAILALFADTVYFLILVYFCGSGLYWLAVLFYVYLLAEALVFSGPGEVAFIAIGAALFCLALPEKAIRSLEPMLVVGGGVTYAFAVHKKKQHLLVEETNARLENAVKIAGMAREDERQRIASDFHDGPLQSFISLQMRLEILRKLLERDVAAGMQDLKQLQALAQSQIRDLRTFLHSMRPVDADGGNLVASLRRAADSFQKESGIPVTFAGAATPVGLPADTTTEVLQMLREALHNVQKHAGATRVAVAMEKTERGLELSVDDNGHGFKFAGTYSLEELELLRLGPASLKRRARSLNADMVLESRPGRGSGIRFRVPLQ